MLKLTKTGIGLLTRQYRSVLKKCWLLNIGLFALSAVFLPRDASAENIPNYYKKSDTYSRNEIDDIQSLNIPYVIVAGWGRLLALCACVLTAGNKVRSGMTRKEEWSGMTGNKSNVILSPLWASGSIVRRSMVRIVKVACGSKDSDGAFAFSAQPLRMTGNNGLVNVVICNGGVIC